MVDSYTQGINDSKYITIVSDFMDKVKERLGGDIFKHINWKWNHKDNINLDGLKVEALCVGIIYNGTTYWNHVGFSYNYPDPVRKEEISTALADKFIDTFCYVAIIAMKEGD